MPDHIDIVKQVCDSYRSKLERLKVLKPVATGASRRKIVSFSDLHIPFVREDLIEEAVKQHSGAEWCVINGDLFDSNLISTFPKHKEVPFVMEYITAEHIVRLLAKHFGTVVLVDGNHDAGRFSRELGKISETIQFLVKGSPLKHLANGERYSPSGEALESIDLPNVVYAGDESPQNWWFQIGGAIFAHRLKGFKAAPMANAVLAADYFMDRGNKFQCIVNGHSHKQGMIAYKGRIVMDQGCLCYPMEYEADGRMTMSPTDLGYAIVELDRNGNIDPVATRNVYLGTYQGA